ncbi:MAG: sensor histidine kinase [Chloroflexota bacterium]
MSNQPQQIDVWEKWDWLWPLIFYASIVFSCIQLLLDDAPLSDNYAPLGLSLLFVLWHWVGMKLAYHIEADWEKRPYLRFIVILGDIAFWFVLVTISPAYYFVLTGMFSQIFHQLPIKWAAMAIFVLTGAIINAQMVDSGQVFSLTNPVFWLYLFMGMSGIVLGLWISSIIRQSSERRELIVELEAAQAALSDAKRHEGMLEERQRLAREIHDTLAQGFTSIVMHLEAAEQALPDDLNTTHKHLDQARTTARMSLDQARRVVQDLRPDLLENQSLPDAIERTAVRWQDETNIPVSMTTTGAPVPLHPAIEVTLLRAVQEGLANIRKHAQATAVQLTLSYMGDVVILDVQDNGVGINGAAPSAFSGGYGLQAMRERAEALGGAVEIENEPHVGTTVVVSIPLGENLP